MILFDKLYSILEEADRLYESVVPTVPYRRPGESEVSFYPSLDDFRRARGQESTT